jgi:hypothetical protein
VSPNGVADDHGGAAGATRCSVRNLADSAGRRSARPQPAFRDVRTRQAPMPPTSATRRLLARLVAAATGQDQCPSPPAARSLRTRTNRGGCRHRSRSYAVSTSSSTTAVGATRTWATGSLGHRPNLLDGIWSGQGWPCSAPESGPHLAPPRPTVAACSRPPVAGHHRRIAPPQRLRRGDRTEDTADYSLTSEAASDLSPPAMPRPIGLRHPLCDHTFNARVLVIRQPRAGHRVLGRRCVVIRLVRHQGCVAGLAVLVIDGLEVGQLAAQAYGAESSFSEPNRPGR